MEKTHKTTQNPHFLHKQMISCIAKPNGTIMLLNKHTTKKVEQRREIKEENSHESLQSRMIKKPLPPDQTSRQIQNGTARTQFDSPNRTPQSRYQAFQNFCIRGDSLVHIERTERSHSYNLSTKTGDIRIAVKHIQSNVKDIYPCQVTLKDNLAE